MLCIFCAENSIRNFLASQKQVPVKPHPLGCGGTCFFDFPKDVFADSREFYEYCLKEPDWGISVGVSKERARERLEFLKRFPPGEHRRLSAHTVDVYLVKSPAWARRGRLVAPKGRLEKVLSLDFGTEIKGKCEEEQGAYEREIPNEHLRIFFDPSEYHKTGVFCYQFDILRPSITRKQPKEYHIRKYVTVDGEKAWEETEVARAAFKTAREEGKTPGRLERMIFTKK